MLEIPVIILYTFLSKIFSFVWGGGSALARRVSGAGPSIEDTKTSSSSAAGKKDAVSDVKVPGSVPAPVAPAPAPIPEPTNEPAKEKSKDEGAKPRSSPSKEEQSPKTKEDIQVKDRKDDPKPEKEEHIIKKEPEPVAPAPAPAPVRPPVEEQKVVEPPRPSAPNQDNNADADTDNDGVGDDFVQPSSDGSPVVPSPEVIDPESPSPQPDDDDSPDIEELNISSFTGTSGTVVEMPGWDVEGAAEKIYKACKGLGTTESDITEVVCSINNAQRQVLREKYLAMYGEDLMDRLKSELNGRFQDVIIGLLTPPDEYLADWLRWALQGAGTEEDTLVEILCCRTNDEIERIKAAYKTKFERDLEEDIESDLTGQFQKLIIAVLACGRDESGSVDRDVVRSDAQELFDAGAAQWGTDESKFNAILCTRSYPHLRQVFKLYEQISGADITEAIDSEFTGDVQAGLLAIVAAVRDPAAYYATKLNSALSGAGTRDNILIRIIVSRSELDLRDIKDAYAAKYETSLAEAIAADTRGDYEEALLKIVG